MTLDDKSEENDSLKGQVYVRKYGEDGNETICLYGDPQGLRSLAKKLHELAELNQEGLEEASLPSGEGFHIHVRGLTEGSLPLDAGRLDGKHNKEIDWFTR